jgi:hypothetical protein
MIELPPVVLVWLLGYLADLSDRSNEAIRTRARELGIPPEVVPTLTITWPRDDEAGFC